jgi:hypothetical protein
MNAIFNSKKTWLILAIVCVCAGVAWWQREPMLAWNYLRQLNGAADEEFEACAQRIADLGEVAVPRLLDGLRDNDATVCARMQYPLVLMARKWGHADDRTATLVEQVRKRFERFSPAGQERAALLVTGILQNDGPKPLPPRVTKAAGELMIAADANAELRPFSLMLAAELLDCVQPGQFVDVARKMAGRGLDDDRPACKVAALHLLLRDPIRKDNELLERAIPLLRHAEPAVRKNAVLVLAGASELVREEAFLPLLHDDDAEVQFLAESALRKRGLSGDDIGIARMISDRDPAIRIRVLLNLRRVPDVNLDTLLRQLSHDPAKAVRAAAIRAAAEYPHIDLSQRLTQMAASDPCESIRMNAQYYVQQRARRAARD